MMEKEQGVSQIFQRRPLEPVHKLGQPRNGYRNDWQTAN